MTIGKTIQALGLATVLSACSEQVIDEKLSDFMAGRRVSLTTADFDLLPALFPQKNPVPATLHSNVVRVPTVKRQPVPEVLPTAPRVLVALPGQKRVDIRKREGGIGGKAQDDKVEVDLIRLPGSS